MLPRVERVLIDRDRIAARVRELGAQIVADLSRDAAPGEQVVLVPILTGSIVFVADLIRQMPLPLSLGVVAVSSYPGAATASQGAGIRGDVPTDLGGKHVLIVDDILDSGRTLGLMRRLIEAQRPKTLRICVLLSKPESSRKEPVKVEYVGFDIPDAFVVGYGLDFDGFYRNLPEIGVLGK
ncbi:MAG: hypoxanthine phosphoribosyltransferase [Phycisphaerales bacterium]